MPVMNRQEYAESDEMTFLECLYGLVLARKYGALRHIIELRKRYLLAEARND